MKNLFALAIFTVFLVLLLSGVPQDITHWWFSETSVSDNLKIGKMTPQSGVINYNSKEVKSTIDISYNKTIISSPNSEVEIVLSNSNFQFKLISANALLKKYKDQTLLILNSGTYMPLSGSAKNFKVLKNSKLYASNTIIKKELPNYRPIIKDAITQAPLIVSEELTDLPHAVDLPKTNKKIPEFLDSEPENAFLDQVIANQSEKLQNCQINRIRELGTVNGQVIVGLEIHPSGEIKNAKILDTNIEDTELMNCLLSVFQRIKLPKYKGEVIYRSYPLLFE